MPDLQTQLAMTKPEQLIAGIWQEFTRRPAGPDDSNGLRATVLAEKPVGYETYLVYRLIKDVAK